MLRPLGVENLRFLPIFARERCVEILIFGVTRDRPTGLELARGRRPH
jgi:hypothetical protein